jgi:diaminopimelate epimerase
MGSVPFVKIQGAGNDFIFIDLRKTVFGSFSSLSRAEFVAKICDRHFGVGADGLVFVEAVASPQTGALASHQADLQWDFYNTDGSFAEMCGNAARCMGLWAALYANLPRFKFATRAGVVRADVLLPIESGLENPRVTVDLDFVKIEWQDIHYKNQGEDKAAVLVNTGVPHAVVEVPSLDNLSLFKEDIAALRFHPQAGERGANVTFLQRGSELRTVTFERGVEDFTLACGTGVLAAAAVALRGTHQAKAELRTPGGVLQVVLGLTSGATLVGDASVVFVGEFNGAEVKLNKGSLK